MIAQQKPMVETPAAGPLPHLRRSEAYRSETCSVSLLDAATVDRLQQLYLQNFDGSSPEIFRGDFAAKDEAIMLYFRDEVVGFTALQYFEHLWHGELIRIVYSGDTIVSPEHWGQQTLAFSWLARVGAMHRRFGPQRMFWFLLVKGHRTYRYLSVFARSFFPHWTFDQGELRQLAEQLAYDKFGERFDPHSGLVKFTPSRGHLKERLAHISPSHASKHAVEYFLSRNPSYAAGHELVCVCELTPGNLKPLAARIFAGAQHPDLLHES